jgi:hypothetical protein
MNMGEFTVVPARRKAVPVLISLSGPSGSGKTLSALLMAAGFAGKEGKVGMIDAENGRGTLYEDDPLVRAALPNGYSYTPITPPYSPSRYVEAIKAQEAAGTTICVIDSTSHEWEGEGGCTDIADKNKQKGMPNWILAKREHKKFTLHTLSSPMSFIFCLRAREKIEVVKDENGREQFINLGIQPIAEKNFHFEMLLSLAFDADTHLYSRGQKAIPKMLLPVFPGNELITKAHGEAIRRWADGGAALEAHEQLQKRARAAAELGFKEYGDFFTGLTKEQKKILADTTHASNKALAEAIDLEAEMAELQEHTGADFFTALGLEGYEDWGAVPADAKPKVAAALRGTLKKAA